MKVQRSLRRRVIVTTNCFRTQSQGDGKMEVSSVGPYFTGHDDEPIDKEDTAKIYDDVTGKMFHGHLVPAARQEEIKFLNTFPVHKKVLEANAKSKECVSFGGVTSINVIVTTWKFSHDFFGRGFRCKDPFMQGTFAATPFWESLRYVLHWVGGDMSGSWTSSCSC